MYKILCPVDFGYTSNNAVDFAAQMAQELGGTITMLHVVQPKLSMNEYVSNVEVHELKTQALERLSLMEEALQLAFGTSRYTTSEVAVGDVVDTIAQISEQQHFDLVVMANPQFSVAESYLFGSGILSRVLEKIKIPSILIPDEYVFQSIRKLVYATDFADGDLEIIGQLAQFAALFRAEMDLLHVATRGEFAENQQIFEAFETITREQIHYGKLSFHQVFSDQVALKINNYIKSSNVQMLTVLSRKKDFFSSFFQNNNIKSLLKYIDIPLMVFHQ